MASIQSCELPGDALLRKYLDDGAYTDCYFTDVAHPVSHAEYVEAFYTTAVFKLERLLLSWLAARPSTDLQARELAAGRLTSFAAWNVEARQPQQLLLSDFRGRTRSWLMTDAAADNQTTRLFFGSAVVPVVDRRSGQAGMSWGFRALLGFHKLYSRVLLRAAASRLARPSPPGIESTPIGILVTVALLALCATYAVWVAIADRSVPFALAGALAIVACVGTARLLAWSRFLVYLLAAAFIGTWAYSLYDAAAAGYFSLFSTRQIVLALAPGAFLMALSCFCTWVVFRQFRAAQKRRRIVP